MMAVYGTLSDKVYIVSELSSYTITYICIKVNLEKYHN